MVRPLGPELIVDMSAMGTALAYLFTCMTAYKYVATFPDIPEAPLGKPVAIIGGLTSISCFAMLALPGSPAAIGIESWFMLLVWVALGGLLLQPRVRAERHPA